MKVLSNNIAFAEDNKLVSNDEHIEMIKSHIFLE